MTIPEEKPVSANTKEGDWSNEVGKKVPNILTALRLAAVPVFVILLMNPTQDNRFWATIIFIVASLTDWLDGYIARIYKAESILGTLLDPLADKVLVMAALVMLAGNAESFVPSWMVVVILAREFLVSGLRSLAALKSTVVPASGSAKHKTAWMLAAIPFLLLGDTRMFFNIEVRLYNVGMVLLWGSMILSVYSGVLYAIRLKKIVFSE